MNIDNNGLIFRISRNRLTRLTGGIAPMLRGNSFIPELNCIKMTLDGKMLTMEASDIHNHAVIKVEVDEVGLQGTGGAAFLLPGHYAGVLDKIGGEDVRFEYEDNSNRIEVLTDGLESAFAPLEIKSFPQQMDQEGGAACFTIQDAPGFIDALSRLTPIPDTSEGRKFLHGIRIHAKNRTMELAALHGGTVLAVAELPSDAMEEAFEGAIMPVPAALHVVRMFKNAKTLDVAIGKRFTVFASDGVSICSRAIDGEYPNYRRIIPEGATGRIKIFGREWLRAIASAEGVTGREDSKEMKIRFSASGAQISMSGKDSREAKLDVGYELISGDIVDFEFMARSSLFRLATSVFDDEVELAVNGLRTLIVLSKGNMIALIMPLTPQKKAVK